MGSIRRPTNSFAARLVSRSRYFSTLLRERARYAACRSPWNQPQARPASVGKGGDVPCRRCAERYQSGPTHRKGFVRSRIFPNNRSHSSRRRLPRVFAGHSRSICKAVESLTVQPRHGADPPVTVAGSSRGRAAGPHRDDWSSLPKPPIDHPDSLPSSRQPLSPVRVAPHQRHRMKRPGPVQKQVLTDDARSFPWAQLCRPESAHPVQPVVQPPASTALDAHVFICGGSLIACAWVADESS